MKIFSNALIIAGTVLLLGTAGASDGGMDMAGVASKILLSFTLIFAGMVALKFADFIKNHRRESHCLKIHSKKGKYYTC